MRIKNKERFVFFSLLGLFTIMYIWKVPYGSGGRDEPFYLTLADRVVKGDALLSEEWNLSQLQAFLIAPILAVYRIFVDTTEGILVNFRYIYLAYHIAVTMGIYYALKKYSKIRVIATLFYYLYIPMSIMAFSYNTLSLSMTVLTMALLLGMEKVTRVRCIIIGLTLAISVVARPHGVLLYVFYTLACIIYWFVRKYQREKNECIQSISMRVWWWITVGSFSLLVVFVIFIFSRTSISEIMENLKFIFDDDFHTMTFWQKIADYKSALFFVFGNNIWIWLGIVVLCMVDRGRQKRKWIYLPIMVVSVIINLLSSCRSGMEGHNYIMFPIVFLGWLTFVLLKEKDWQSFGICFVGGVIYSFCNHWGSDLRTDIIAAGVVPIGIVSILWLGELVKENFGEPCKRKLAITGSVLFFLVFQLGAEVYSNMHHSFWMDTLWDENQTITEGPLKNVIIKKASAGTEVLSLKDLEFVKDLEDKKIMFVSPRTWFYLYADMEYGTPSPWIAKIDDNYVLRVMDYFELHPDKKADYIYIGAGDGWDYSSVERIAPYYGYGKVTFTNRGCFLERTEY